MTVHHHYVAQERTPKGWVAVGKPTSKKHATALSRAINGRVWNVQTDSEPKEEEVTEKELFQEPTVGELMQAARAAAPNSIQVDGFRITYIHTIPVTAGSTASRWCFTCRTVTEHSSSAVLVVGESMDTPPHEVHCLTCGGKDTDLFPGREREDDEPE